jgi:hypothetical protein
MESLYYLSLSYLRENYHLIDFTALNPDVSHDMVSMIRDPRYLSVNNELKCYDIINRDELDVYLVAYHKNSKYVTVYDGPRYHYEIATIENGRASTHAPGYNISPLYMIYEIATDTFYKVDRGCFKQFEHHVYPKEFLHGEYADIFTNCARYCITRALVEARTFDTVCPGLLEWAIEHGYVSREIIVPRDKVVRQCDA